MKLYHAGELIGEVITNHSITTEDALELLGAKPYEMINTDDPQYILNGKEIWYDDITEEW